jgi:plastocyanin
MVRRYVTIVVMLISIGSVSYGAQHVIGQKGRLFKPGVMTVKAGDSVMFKNDDAVTHHIYSSTKGHEFDLKTTSPGKNASRTFAAAGRVDIRCGLHPGMRLVVTVE